MADIAADGPFSAFPGIERWFVVLAGSGVSLAFAEGERVVRAGDPPLRFDGGAAPGCRLLGGPTCDLNLMLRDARGVMEPVIPGAAWEAGFAQRGLFTAVAGQWSGAGEARRFGAHTLLWEDAAGTGDWRFEPDDPGVRVPGWWLGLAPGNVPVPVR
jgi:environmental stress-induced protein Ves